MAEMEIKSRYKYPSGGFAVGEIKSVSGSINIKLWPPLKLEMARGWYNCRKIYGNKNHTNKVNLQWEFGKIGTLVAALDSFCLFKEVFSPSVVL